MLSNLLSQCTVPGHNLPSRGIEHALRLAIEWVFNRNQIAERIGKGGDVVQRVFDRERLALGIDRDGRDLAQRIGDGLEIALGVIAERGRAVERIGEGGEWCKVKQCPHLFYSTSVLLSFWLFFVPPLPLGKKSTKRK